MRPDRIRATNRSILFIANVAGGAREYITVGFFKQGTTAVGKDAAHVSKGCSAEHARPPELEEETSCSDTACTSPGAISVFQRQWLVGLALPTPEKDASVVALPAAASADAYL